MYTDTRHGTVQVKIKQGNAVRVRSGQSIYIVSSTPYIPVYIHIYRKQEKQ